MNMKYRDMRTLVSEGRLELFRITGQDFRYDVMKWHEYLVTSDAKGYKFDDGHEKLHKMIFETLDNEEWNSVVTQLEGEVDRVEEEVNRVEYKPIPEDASESKFNLKDRVRVLSRGGKNTEKEGRVSKLIWHHKHRSWCYYLEVDHALLKKRYFKEDLELL